MIDITLAIIGADGTMLIDDTDKDLSTDMQADLAEFGDPEGTACANPNQPLLQLPEAQRCSSCGKRYGSDCAEGACSRYTGRPLMTARIGGYYHSSQIDGPGLRSVARFQGCPIHCDGCYVPQTWSFGDGTAVAIDALADALLDPAYDRDGVTIIGGEPFAQPAALNALIGELRGRDPALNVCVYSGFTLEALRMRHDPDIDGVLASINILIDGPFVKKLNHGSLNPYTGSSNQRVHYLR